jgi:hypothetical protein
MSKIGVYRIGKRGRMAVYTCCGLLLISMTDTRTAVGQLPKPTISTTPFSSLAFVTEYDAEAHIGLVANDPSPTVAAANTKTLSEALNAMWAGGKFRFRDGSVGPLLKAIKCAGKAFFFKGTIETSPRIGGTLLGMGRGMEMSEAAYTDKGPFGGATTRFIRIDGENGGAVLRLRGVGFTVQGIEFLGRRFIVGEAGKAVGTRTPSLIEVEGRGAPPSGRHIIRDCGFYEGEVGIRALRGYYDENNKFVIYENQADQSAVENAEFFAVGSCFRSENAQAVGWDFRRIVLNEFGYDEDTVVFDIERGGNFYASNVQLNQSKVTLLKVRDCHAPNANRYEIAGARWDHASQDPKSYLCLFQYAGKDFAGAHNLRWSVRVTGHMNNPHLPFDTSKLIQIPAEAKGFPKDDLLFDITNLPEAGFKPVGGPWKSPQ